MARHEHEHERHKAEGGGVNVPKEDIDTRPEARTNAGPIDREAEGFHARVVQHECDHLIGRLYPTRMRDFTQFGFTSVLFPEMDPNADD